MSAGHGQCLQSAPTRVEPAQVPSWKVAHEKVVWESDAEKTSYLGSFHRRRSFPPLARIGQRSDGQTRTRRNECGRRRFVGDSNFTNSAGLGERLATSVNCDVNSQSFA
jgi:hypothetical protein